LLGRNSATWTTPPAFPYHFLSTCLALSILLSALHTLSHLILDESQSYKTREWQAQVQVHSKELVGIEF
jgi:hypothetical protein